MADRYRLTTEDSRKGGRAGAQTLWTKYKGWKQEREASTVGDDHVSRACATIAPLVPSSPTLQALPSRPLARALPPGVYHPDGRVPQPPLPGQAGQAEQATPVDKDRTRDDA